MAPKHHHNESSCEAYEVKSLCKKCSQPNTPIRFCLDCMTEICSTCFDQLPKVDGDGNENKRTCSACNKAAEFKQDEIATAEIKEKVGNRRYFCKMCDSQNIVDPKHHRCCDDALAKFQKVEEEIRHRQTEVEKQEKEAEQKMQAAMKRKNECDAEMTRLKAQNETVIGNSLGKNIHEIDIVNTNNMDAIDAIDHKAADERNKLFKETDEKVAQERRRATDALVEANKSVAGEAGVSNKKLEKETATIKAQRNTKITEAKQKIQTVTDENLKKQDEEFQAKCADFDKKEREHLEAMEQKRAEASALAEKMLAFAKKLTKM